MRKSIALTAVVGSMFFVGACGGGGTGSETEPNTNSNGGGMSSSAPAPSETEDMMEDDNMMDPAANLVGPGCEDYAAQVPDGAGSVGGMAQAPVAEAASNNPLLTTLTSTVTGEFNPDVNLVDTLNGGEFTVFAPVDSAFEALPPETLDSLSTDAEGLTNILTYHVVPGQLSPEEVVGTQDTVQGGTVEVTGEGDNLQVNGANVICGGVQTANATVYLIDGVLTPTA